MEPFRFKHFALRHEASSQRIGTDSVLLGVLAPIENVHTVLDVGCGCGVIGFCIADRLRRAGNKDIVITGVDIDTASVQEAQENAAHFPTPDAIRFEFRKESIQEHVRLAEPHCYDLIVSNPPFFVSSLKPADERRRQARHTDGTLSFCELAEGASKLLTPAGRFAVILPTTESKAFEEAATGHLHLMQQTVIRPLPGKPVHRIVSIFTLKPVSHVEQAELSIRDEGHHFSEGYRQLTKEFYLEF
ncbi:MAG: methyltransferase domain-containing protein [Bacteroidales bacterium]|nr:methyltransferase domain-containing protein [Bacteroidales bacterium]